MDSVEPKINDICYKLYITMDKVFKITFWKQKLQVKFLRMVEHNIEVALPNYFFLRWFSHQDEGYSSGTITFHGHSNMRQEARIRTAK